MSPFVFGCRGHKNILSTHKNTLEFTKDESLTLNGDCILGVSADFEKEKLFNFINRCKGQIRAEIRVGNLRDEFNFFLNNGFCDDQEIVIRRSGFISERTLGIRCDKAAIDINRKIVDTLRDPNSRLEVIFHEKKDIKQERDKEPK